MHQVFLRGLVFGLGLSISLAAAYGVYRVFRGFTLNPTPIESTVPLQSAELDRVEPEFTDLSVEERISKSSVIFVARFEEAEDGRLKAVISEVLKKKDDAAFPFAVGDEYPRASIYPEAGVDYGTGVAVFLVGPDASFTSSVSIHTDRVFGLGDMPLELLRKKCSSGA
jgi:hypothetical protein